MGLSLSLLTNEAATCQPITVLRGGRYLWAAVGTFGGAALTLQGLGPDGATWQNVTTLAAAGQVSVFVGEGEQLRVSVSGGSPSALYSTLTRAG